MTFCNYVHILKLLITNVTKIRKYFAYIKIKNL